MCNAPLCGAAPPRTPRASGGGWVAKEEEAAECGWVAKGAPECCPPARRSCAPASRRQCDDSALREEVADSLRARGVASELIKGWALREQQALCPHSHDSLDASPLDPVMREAALQILHVLGEVAGLGLAGWYTAAVLFDAQYLRRKSRVHEALPTVCAAVVSLVRKTDSSTWRCRADALADKASELARGLHVYPHSADCEVKLQDLLQEERAILKTMGWRLDIPSVFSWMSALCERFNIVSCGLVASNLEFVFQQLALPGARTLVMRNAATPELAPRRVANGLFCLGLVTAQLMPLDALRPDELDSQSWEALFTRGPGAVPRCALPPGHARQIFEVLQVAAGCDADTLKADALAVALELQAALVESQCAEIQCAQMQQCGLMQCAGIQCPHTQCA